MADKTFTIPENKNDPANMDGTLTNDTDFIIKYLNEVICEYVDFKIKFEREREKLTA
ncbi:hypothetical protein KAR91_46005 [Candidatus Pacearchaeota archaeon]|nr:hypothetical protein [Candidatus Pacearchaeota archaeon]